MAGTSYKASPCPFCKRNEISVLPYTDNRMFVRCDMCNADGPLAADTTEAIKLWNAAPRHYSSVKLSPCLFCGSQDVIMHKTSGGYHFVHCENGECNADGPVDLGESGAAEKWNTRVV